MGFFDLFKFKKSAQSGDAEPLSEVTTIFYHEDDYLQVEILPHDNLAYLEAESKRVNDFGNEHLDGSGYTDMYVRNAERTELKERQIRPGDLEQSLATLGLDRISKVLTGYGQTFREPHKNCVAFGKDYSAIYYDSRDDIVQHIWLTNHWGIDRKKLASCLHEMGQQWQLVLQDWNLTTAVDLSDRMAIEGYLSAYDHDPG